MSDKSKDAAAPADAPMEEEKLRGGGETGEGSSEAPEAEVTEERREEGERAEEKDEREKQHEERGKEEEKKKGKGTANRTHSPFLSCFCIKTTSEISSHFHFLFRRLASLARSALLLSSTSSSYCISKTSGSANRGIGAKAARVPKIRDKKPADFDSWSKERQKREWWGPRNAVRDQKKAAERQQQHQQRQQQQQQQRQQKQQQQQQQQQPQWQQQQGWSATGRSAPVGAPTGPRLQPRAYHPYQPYQQGPPARDYQLGGGPTPEFRQAQRTPYDRSRAIIDVPSPYDAPQSYPLHPTPQPPRQAPSASAPPVAASPVVTAGAPSMTAPIQGGKKGLHKPTNAKKEKKKAKKAEERKAKNLDKAFEHAQKKAEEEKESLQQAVARALAEQMEKMEQEKKEEKKEKKAKKAKEAEEKQKEEEKEKRQVEREERAQRQFDLFMEQNERQERENVRRIRLQAVESLYHDSMAWLDDRLATTSTQLAVATTAGDSIRIVHLQAMLNRAREFRTLASNMVADARQDLLSPEGAEAREQRFLRELSRAQSAASNAIMDIAVRILESTAPIVAPALPARVAPAGTGPSLLPVLPIIFLNHPTSRDDGDKKEKKEKEEKRVEEDPTSISLSQWRDIVSSLGGNTINSNISDTAVPRVSLPAPVPPQQLLQNDEMGIDLSEEMELRSVVAQRSADMMRRRRAEREHNAPRGFIAYEVVSDNETEPAQPDNRQMVVHAPPHMSHRGVHVNDLGQMVNHNGQPIDANGDLVDSAFYIIEPSTGQRKVDLQGRQRQGRPFN